MNLNQRTAMVIRSLMRDLAVSEHIVMPQGGPNIRATKVVEELDAMGSPEVVRTINAAIREWHAGTPKDREQPMAELIAERLGVGP